MPRTHSAPCTSSFGGVPSDRAPCRAIPAAAASSRASGRGSVRRSCLATRCDQLVDAQHQRRPACRRRRIVVAHRRRRRDRRQQRQQQDVALHRDRQAPHAARHCRSVPAALQYLMTRARSVPPTEWNVALALPRSPCLQKARAMTEKARLDFAVGQRVARLADGLARSGVDLLLGGVELCGHLGRQRLLLGRRWCAPIWSSSRRAARWARAGRRAALTAARRAGRSAAASASARRRRRTGGASQAGLDLGRRGLRRPIGGALGTGAAGFCVSLSTPTAPPITASSAPAMNAAFLPSLPGRAACEVGGMAARDLTARAGRRRRQARRAPASPRTPRRRRFARARSSVCSGRPGQRVDERAPRRGSAARDPSPAPARRRRRRSAARPAPAAPAAAGVVDHLEDHLGQRVAHERRPPRQHLVDDGAEARTRRCARRAPRSCPSACSGAMYCGVPSSTESCVCTVCEPRILEMPKSSTLT